MQLRRVCPYQVGDVYITTLTSNPATLWPNTVWEAIRGKFLFAEDASHAAGSTGGAASHTLTIDEMPSHTHGSKSLTGQFMCLVWGIQEQEYSNGIVSWLPTFRWRDRKGDSGNDWGSQLYQIDASHEHDAVGGVCVFNASPISRGAYVEANRLRLRKAA